MKIKLRLWNHHCNSQLNILIQPSYQKNLRFRNWMRL